MKIVHILFGGAFNEDMSYQGNILPKENKLAGHDVIIIASCYKWKEGEKVKVPEEDGITKDGIRLIRLKFEKIFVESISKKIKKVKRMKEILEELEPDIIFHHDVQGFELLEVAKYKKQHKSVKLIVDNHTDFYNSGKNWVSKNILHRIIWKRIAKIVQPYVDQFYGVLPARVDFLINEYNISKEKVELLVMGAEDDKVKEVQSPEIISKTREDNNIVSDDFLIVTGGKLDSNKTQTLLLMEAISKIDNPKVKLLIFGSVSSQYKNKFASLLSDRVKYIGWVNANETYKYFNAADLVVFPGLHSVFWEQVVGLGKPCVFKYMEGFTHIDLGGNCQFLYNDSIKEMKNVINRIITNSENYNDM